MRVFVSVDISQGVVLIRQLVAVSTGMVVVNRNVLFFCSLALELHQVRVADRWDCCLPVVIDNANEQGRCQRAGHRCSNSVSKGTVTC